MQGQVQITRARHSWPEKDGFTINRPKGMNQYTFLHFFNSVEINIDGKLIQTPPDTCIFYDTDTPQFFRSIGPLRHNWMHMTGDVACTLVALSLPKNTLLFPNSTNFITTIMREIEIELLSNAPHKELLLHSKYQELLVRLARSCQSNQDYSPLKPKTQEALIHLRREIFSQLDRNWSVEEMASLACMSPSRFHTMYRQQFGISPTDDLIHAKIDMAKYRLSSTDTSVVHLAESLGYHNITHFCRQFKQHTGMTAGQYRKSQKG